MISGKTFSKGMKIKDYGSLNLGRIQTEAAE